jgi:hypothetical protein
MNYWKTASAQRLSRRRALAGAGAGTLAGVLLAACGGDDGSGSTDTGSLVTRPVDTSKQAKRGGVMQFYRDREVTTSDPHFTSRTQPGTASTYSRLFRRKPGHLGPQPVEFIGDLSESWEVSPDKLQITIKLKPATWHNVAPVSGRPVDGQDIAYSGSESLAAGQRGQPFRTHRVDSCHRQPYHPDQDIAARGGAVRPAQRHDFGLLVDHSPRVGG